MKHALLIVSAILILFTTACTAAMLIPAATLIESLSHHDSQEVKVAESIPTPSLGQIDESDFIQEVGNDPQKGGNAPAHISGSKKPRIHISGKAAQKSHISGRSFGHVSGGSYY